MAATGRGPEDRHRAGGSRETASKRLAHGAIPTPVDIADPTVARSK